MSWTVYVALYGWVPAVLIMFAVLPRRRAALAALVLGYLFLPQAAIHGAAFLDVSKVAVIGIGLLLGILLFDSGLLGTIRFEWYDIPIFVWCLAPLASSLSNGLGVYDGLSGVLGAIWGFGVPYLVGRVYVRDWDGAVALATSLTVGGLLYVPLCLYEIRMSPQLHYLTYGFQQHVFAQARRFGGWRPLVFLQHGLALGLWMGAATVAAFGLWRGRRLTRLSGLPPWLIVLALGLTTFFCKSLGSLILAAMAIGTILVCRWFGSRLPLLVLVLLAPAYVTARSFFDWRAEAVVELADRIDHDRGLSLQGRIATDAVLRDRAMMRPMFGWGGWNRIREGLPPMLTDSFWALVFAQKGLVGLMSFFGMLLLAQLLPLRRLRRRGRSISDHPEILALVAILAMHTLDCTMNAMHSPVYIAVAGALIGFGSQAQASAQTGHSPRGGDGLRRRPGA